MRIVAVSLAAMFASTFCLALLFLYALIAPTRPLPTPALTKDFAFAWTGPGAPRIITTEPGGRRTVTAAAAPREGRTR